jgi:type II secretory pathway component GspD/PulD (secretin)
MNFLDSDIDLKTDGRLQLMTTTGVEQNIIFDALKRVGEVQVQADPSITVQDGNEASIKVITDQPYESGTSEVDSGGVTTSYTNYEFIEVGVSLTVIPTINDEGFINMLISPEVSSLRNEWYGGDPQAAGAVPVVTKSTASTTVTIKDGVTVMIAGLIREELEDTESKFPLLGDIYLLGKLFTHNEQVTSRSETIIFITPHVVDGTKSLDFARSAGGGKGSKRIKGLR